MRLGLLQEWIPETLKDGFRAMLQGVSSNGRLERHSEGV